jgi:CXXX repeat radical SAM target protein
MTKERKPAERMDRRGFLRVGVKIIPSLAVMGLAATAMPEPARASCFGTCHGSCSGDCVESCKGDCMGSCKGSCGGCDNTCTGTCTGTSK